MAGGLLTGQRVCVVRTVGRAETRPAKHLAQSSLLHQADHPHGSAQIILVATLPGRQG